MPWFHLAKLICPLMSAFFTFAFQIHCVTAWAGVVWFSKQYCWSLSRVSISRSLTHYRLILTAPVRSSSDQIHSCIISFMLTPFLRASLLNAKCALAVMEMLTLFLGE